MNKKILIGSIIAVVVLVMMPSIPAIQQKIIEERTYNNLVEQLNLKDVREIKGLERIKHPFLFLIYYVILVSRLTRGWIYLGISSDWDGYWPGPEIKHPLLFIRSLMLLFSVDYWIIFWSIISHIMKWNWPS